MDLSRKPEGRALIREEIRKCNETLPEAGKVRRFLLLTKDLEADDAEMTRTRKVRRRYVDEKCTPVPDAFYGGRDEVELATTITYEDGRQATLQSRVRVEDVEEAAVRGRLAVHGPPAVQRRAHRPDVLADRAGLRARLQGDRRHQLRAGRVRHDLGLRGGGRPHGVGDAALARGGARAGRYDRPGLRARARDAAPAHRPPRHRGGHGHHRARVDPARRRAVHHLLGDLAAAAS